MKKLFAALVAASLAALGAVVTASNADAHAVINAGSYRVAIGWESEPTSGSDTYVGELNAIQVFVDSGATDTSTGTPVSDLNGDCSKPDFQVTVTVGTTTSSPFCPALAFDDDTGNGRHDEYDYPLIPTVPGTYTFHIFGSIHGTAIDKTIASGPGTFDSLANTSAVDFPTAVPPVSAVVTKVDQVDTRAGTAQSAAQSATSSANTAMQVAIIAIVLAVIAGAASAMTAMRRRSA